MHVEEGPQPPNNLAKQWSLIPSVSFDDVPLGKKFGDVEKDVNPYYIRGVNCVMFVCGVYLSVCLCCRNLW